MSMNLIERFFTAPFPTRLGLIEWPLLISVLFSPYMAFAYIAFCLANLRATMLPYKFTFNVSTQCAGNMAILQFVLAVVFLLTGIPFWFPLIISLVSLWYFEYRIIGLIADLECREIEESYANADKH